MNKSHSNYDDYLHKMKKKGDSKPMKINLDPSRQNMKPRPLGLTDGQYFALALKEGHEMLDAEEKKNSVKSKKPKASKVQDALAKTSTNPYVRARAELLDKMTPAFRTLIESMESGETPKDARYDKFCLDIQALGDKLSSSN